MRCGHAADASLAPTETPPRHCGTDPQRRVPGSFENFGATAAKSVQLAGQPKRESVRGLSARCFADTWVSIRRRRESAPKSSPARSADELFLLCRGCCPSSFPTDAASRDSDSPTRCRSSVSAGGWSLQALVRDPLG
jgi:hypothetical protein